MKSKWFTVFGLTVFLRVGVGATVTATDGDWSATQVVLKNTPEAALMVRVGDIDNLGFGFPQNFDPFSGNTTPAHAYPWTVNPADPAGTDRIMVLTSYTGKPPNGADGYVGSTARPANSVQPITLKFDPAGLTIANAALQLFVDDFQASSWGAHYTVTLNGQPFPELEAIINALNQTGPIGKLISAPVPANLLNQIATGQVALKIDDLTTGAGDGYAIDFVKLIVNRAGVLPSGTITGTITDATSHQPIPGATVRAFDRQTLSDSKGDYTITSVPAGLAFVEASASGYQTKSRTVDLVAGQTVQSVNFDLPRGATSLNIYFAVELEFFGHVGATYAVQYSPDLAQWTDDETITGEGKLITRFRSTRNANARYWRAVAK